MEFDVYLLLIMSFGWILTVFQYVLPLISRLTSPAQTLIKKRDISLKKRVAVIVPCFNEGAQVYETIKSMAASDYPHDLMEIVAVDDHSTDDSWEWIQKAYSELKTGFKVTIFRQPVNYGKYPALLQGAHLTKDADIFVCVDSDCIFEKNAITNLVSSFTSDDIGAVGGHVRVSNVNDNLLTQAQTLVYFYAYHVMKMFQNYLDNVCCISGCLLAIRSKAFFQIAPDVTRCNFLGAKFAAGEDRYMTHLLMLNGYKTIVNLDAHCWSTVPNKFRKFFLQQWRWRRSGIQDYLLTLKTMRRHIRSINTFTIINLLLPETINYLLLFTLFFAILQNLFFQWIFLHQMFSIAVMGPFVLLVKMYMKKVSPEQAPKSSVLVILPLVVAWAITGTALGAFLALFTMDNESWGTRIAAPEKEEQNSDDKIAVQKQEVDR